MVVVPRFAHHISAELGQSWELNVQLDVIGEWSIDVSCRVISLLPLPFLKPTTSKDSNSAKDGLSLDVFSFSLSFPALGDHAKAPSQKKKTIH